MKVSGAWTLDDCPSFMDEMQIEFDGETMIVHFTKQNGESYASARVPIPEVELLIETQRRLKK